MIVALLDDGIDVNRCPGFSIKYDLIVEADGTIRPRRAGGARCDRSWDHLCANYPYLRS